MYIVRLAKQLQRFLKRLEVDTYRRVMNKLKELEENPFPTDVKRVVGKDGKIFRVRVGNYRIQYEVIPEDKTIVATNIEKRPRAY